MKFEDRFLLKFCDLDRPGLDKPFRILNHVYATDGKILLRIKKSYAEQKYEGNEKFFNVLSKFPWEQCKENLQKLPRIPGFKQEMEKCDECEGEGEVILQNVFNTYKFCCKTCDGYGMVDKMKLWPVGSINFQHQYLCMIQRLPRLKINLTKTKYGMPFKFTGGEGFLMYCRENENET